MKGNISTGSIFCDIHFGKGKAGIFKLRVHKYDDVTTKKCNLICFVYGKVYET